MTRAKPGEGLRGNHRRKCERIMVNREGPNSPRVSSDLGGQPRRSTPSYSRQDRQQSASAAGKGRRGGNNGDKKGNRDKEERRNNTPGIWKLSLSRRRPRRQACDDGDIPAAKRWRRDTS